MSSDMANKTDKAKNSTNETTENESTTNNSISP